MPLIPVVNDTTIMIGETNRGDPPELNLPGFLMLIRRPDCITMIE